MSRGGVRSILGGFVGPTGGDPNLVLRYARLLREAGGALLLPHQLKSLSAAAREEIEREQDKAYGKKRGKDGAK
ncbi:hypothetical protein FHS78_000633 [Parvibaculum indicum]|uniref:hypothetical protein n=1 Tax=Parvibaculum indicum TaxID=562969 RepID=UPI00141F7C9B|nr:hypothetical protein [Parvibaculum indicum]NIJ40363.1 hypothetical protein [Parvibaculum indicum]